MSKKDATVKEFTLPNRKVKIVPLKRKRGLLPKSHEASFLFKESYYEVCVPIDERGRMKDPLTPEERAFFESSSSGMDFDSNELSVTRDKNYYTKKKAKVRLKNEVTYLDLSRPDDYMKYKILLTVGDRIALSDDPKETRVTQKFALVDENHETQQQLNSLDTKLAAYTEYGAIKKDFRSLRHVVMVATGKKVAKNAKLEFLQTEANRLLDNAPEAFLNAVRDKDLETKILIQDALSGKILNKQGIAYYTPGGDLIGNNLAESVEFLNNKKNQDLRLVIEKKVDDMDD